MNKMDPIARADQIKTLREIAKDERKDRDPALELVIVGNASLFIDEVRPWIRARIEQWILTNRIPHWMENIPRIGWIRGVNYMDIQTEIITRRYESSFENALLDNDRQIRSALSPALKEFWDFIDKEMDAVGKKHDILLIRVKHGPAEHLPAWLFDLARPYGWKPEKRKKALASSGRKAGKKQK